MRDDGIIGKYAIGGAVASTFYIEPTSTYDIDIFIQFENIPGSALASTSKIYEYLRGQHCREQGAHFLIAGWQVQFLPAADNLYKEALAQSIEVDLGGIKTWVMTAEHLIAIGLKMGRGKGRNQRPNLKRATTNHCERTNLSLRIFTRRFTRLTMGFSKTLENLRHAVALFVCHFNFCRVHSAHGKTPAHAAGLAERAWTIEEILSATIWCSTMP